MSRLALQQSEADELSEIKGRRRLEWLACRWLTHITLNELHLSDDFHRIAVLKDEFGKPYLKDAPLEVSFSHSHGRVAVLLQTVPCGIDIQFFVPKIQRIAHKFLSVQEAESLDAAHLLEHLHCYWVIKEAVFKAYGRRQLEFREHILVSPFAYNETATTLARVVKDASRHDYLVQLERHENYFLAWCHEITGLSPTTLATPPGC